MHQSKTTPASSSVHDDAYWDKLWDRQEKAVENARKIPSDRTVEYARAEPIKFNVVRNQR